MKSTLDGIFEVVDTSDTTDAKHRWQLSIPTANGGIYPTRKGIALFGNKGWAKHTEEIGAIVATWQACEADVKQIDLADSDQTAELRPAGSPAASTRSFRGHRQVGRCSS